MNVSQGSRFLSVHLKAALLGLTIWMANTLTNATSLAARPNVVFITVDDMNCDSVGAYGCPLPEITPAIDSLAASGMRFEHAHVTIAICQPTRAVWMTGRYPHRNGALGFDPINADVPTLVEALRDAGYYTGILGKTTHVVPTRAGAWTEATKMEQLGFGRDPKKYRTRVSEIIQNADKESRPFFIMANAHDPHRPFEDSNRSEKKRATFEFPRSEKHIRGDNIPVPGFLADLPNVRTEMAQYYRSVRRADDVVGSVLAAIESAGQVDNTMVIFKSDHGMPLPFAKTNCWRHSTRTPWIVRWPGVVKADSHDTEHVVSGVDLAPTILEAAGLSNLPGADGTSLVPILRGHTQANRDFAITHINRTSGKNQYPMRSVVGKRFGYIYNGWANGETVFKNESQAGLTMKALRHAAKTDPQLQTRVDHFLYRTTEEFYDYASDPDARTNLIANPTFSNQITTLRNELFSHMRQTSDPELAAFETVQSACKIQVQPLDTNVSFRGLHVVDKSTVWATGQNGTTLRTIDAGKSWGIGKIAGTETLDYRGVAGLSADVAVATSAGSPARIVKTTDGGKSWRTVFESNDERVFFDAVAFWDATHGIAFSDPVDGKLLVMTTDDAGESWAATDSLRMPAALPGEAGFAASNSCLTLCGDSQAWIGLGGETSQSGARVFYSADRGENWKISNTPIATGKSSGVFSLAFRSPQYGVAVGGDYTKLDAGGAAVVAVTRDGGATWNRIIGPGPNGFRSAVTTVKVKGRDAFVACGPNGADVSFDGGQSWRPLTVRPEEAAFHAIQFANSVGFGVGADGRVGRLELQD